MGPWILATQPPGKSLGIILLGVIISSPAVHLVLQDLTCALLLGLIKMIRVWQKHLIHYGDTLIKEIECRLRLPWRECILDLPGPLIYKFIFTLSPAGVSTKGKLWQ